ncbi:DUF1707 domain-containing protein [Streptomyces sp. NPDC059009]|uniref:DUF1707 SHOCT-like domain-containing protein n=1 Tax=Streptomyces sp. NPDC059009 TaxID=3346694 RepID=UPI0036909CE9
MTVDHRKGPRAEDNGLRAGNTGLRAGDAERDQAVEALGQHYAEGRLDARTYETRSAAALRATGVSELTALFTDLPAPRPLYAGRNPKRESGGIRSRRVALAVAGAVWPLTFLIVIATGMWQLVLVPVAFTSITGIRLRRSSRRPRRRGDDR